VYNDLYAAWKREVDDTTLGGLSPDFYGNISNYLRHLKEENMLDQKSIKMKLIEHEAENVKFMLDELLDLRYRKIIKNISRNQKVPFELLTVEEKKMAETFSTFSSSYKKFREDLKQGLLEESPSMKVVMKTNNKTAPSPAADAQKRVTVRFVKNIPAIMGADMKSYGPFNAEDVASLPALNAQILVKQGLAVLIEVS
jgi:DNA replication factor GINS